ncbi:MAG: long-chain fatty acid--CoA ligase [Deltaproteobacteria bacterium]|nr:long-chain fatty acid--CoA ligase [Deltaproteobacteria bacterium]
MDLTRFTELTPAPFVLVERAAELATRPRFMVPDGDDWRVVTWAAFARAMRHVGLWLGAQGIAPGDRVAVFASSSVEWMAAALGIQAAGGVMVPIYPASTADDAAYVVRHSDARVVFVDGPAPIGRLLSAWPGRDAVARIGLLSDRTDVLATLADLRARGASCPEPGDVADRIVPWSQVQKVGDAIERADAKSFERLLGQVSLDRSGVMLYTSGTSGRPKGVPLSHRNVAVNGLDWLRCNAPLLDEGMVDLMWLPMSHIFGFGEACLGNTLGFTTYLVEPQHVLAQMPRVRPDVFMSVPAYWEKLAADALATTDPEERRRVLRERTGGRLRFCLSGGAGLRRDVKEVFHQAGLLIVEGYGLTETSPTLTLNRPDQFRFDSVGKPLPSVELTLAEDGEILARGPNVFGGYHKDPAATREAFTDDGWFKTGDVGRFTEDGFLQIIDRKKDILVTSGGKNVAPANVEMRFRDDPFLTHVVVYGDAKRYLVAAAWLDVGAVEAHLAESHVAPEARAEAARALVQRRVDRVNSELASFESIKRFAIIEEPLTVESGLLTASLKVRRKAVYERFRATFESLYDEAPASVAPQHEAAR